MKLGKMRIKSQLLIFLVLSISAGLVYSIVTSTGLLASGKMRLMQQWPQTDFSKTIIDLSEIQSGGPPKDGIPAIDNPKFITQAQARDWLHPQEPVIALYLGKQSRAYPLQILMYHEIVNDEIDGQPITITFCPLCNATLIFDRRLDGEVLDFGTTGKLRKSDLIMYDRQTESWWQQFTGESVVGFYAGKTLKQLPAFIIAYADFESAYPDGIVLSRQTGHKRPYGRNPYRGYDQIGEPPFLFKDPTDPRLPAMERVLSVRTARQQRIYPFSEIVKLTVINDQMADFPLVVFSKMGTFSPLDKQEITRSRLIPSATAYARTLDGNRLDFKYVNNQIRDTSTESVWDITGRAIDGPLKGKRLVPVDSGVHFAFAWLAFNPETEIYRSAEQR